ncbi:hypothetical protein L228DRAFT_142378 [Xylona heveae TC161]|uniref:Zinc finger PHD-type domain-containing protein n=1 Tax=Xylona heveae (strain CBS 132557 / TC161) TaxID=1328760 RepID=A0A165H6M0_XYLHT|nr:hypothetical protein L228DRAFT_142378 [Xylona heveae TC161]KZF23056.1 hypothetical protein L228DRAFT_142378 [Xylona heveae TC161]
MSPRRSSRARTTQPATGRHQTNSSASSTSSTRVERNTRSYNKNNSPQKSTPPHSRSSEEIDSLAGLGEAPQTRRRRRDHGDAQEDDNMVRRNERSIEEEEEEEEEEVTRCICGQLEYPGPPVSIRELNLKAEGDHGVSALPPEGLPEDAGGLFIQCDICKVWQHGGCVGIMDEAMSPEEYFCEQCRRDLHKIVTGSNGQKSSRYLPVVSVFSPRLSRAGSTSKEAEQKSTRDSKASRQSAAALSTKRRSTMNSRDAAYDEEEQLRRAIEESKGEGKATSTDNGSRRGKRGRSDSSEEPKQDTKRQRTNSASPSPPSRPNNSTPHNGESDDETPSRSNGGPKKGRGAASRNQRDRESKDKERERERADAAGRRKGRAERRRNDGALNASLKLKRTSAHLPSDLDAQDEAPPSRAGSNKNGQENVSSLDVLASAVPPAGTPPPAALASITTSHRKTGRPPARRGRVGRNQYTKDREGDLDGSPDRSHSRDAGGADDVGSGINGSVPVESGKPSKPRYINPHRTTMNEMKRRVAGILEFISRTQVEMAGETTPPGGTSSTPSVVAQTTTVFQSNGPLLTLNGAEKEFGDLNSLEMMDVLTRKLVLWQKEYGKYGEK